MEEVEEEVADELPLEGAGQMLCRVRNEQGLAIGDIAERTKIPSRYIEIIESGEFSKLPGRTYALGFTRTYARILGLSESEVTGLVRNELALSRNSVPEYITSFEPGDPAKVPSRGLAWTSAIAAVILMLGAGSYFAQRSGIGIGPDPIVGDNVERLARPGNVATAQPASGVAKPIHKDGLVTFTALEDGIWVRFYDAQGRRLMEKQMAAGEQYEIPSDAAGPQIWTGRPDAFAITVDGQAVPKLANEETTIRDVAISAEALLARNDRAGAITAIN